MLVLALLLFGPGRRHGSSPGRGRLTTQRIPERRLREPCSAGAGSRRSYEQANDGTDLRDERTWTRSQSWLASHSPFPPRAGSAGRRRPASGSVMTPASRISHVTPGPPFHVRSSPVPPPWRTLLAATSWTATIRSWARSSSSRARLAASATVQADVPEPREVERQLVGRRAGLRKRRGERLPDRLQPAVLTAGLGDAVLAHLRVAAPALCDHIRVERRGVVRADQRPARA